MSPEGREVDVDGRTLRLTNLDKVLWPDSGWTKGDMVDYYARVAGVMLPHLAGRAVTLRRWPDGVAGQGFFEKRCPSHRPDWVPTATLGEVGYCLLQERAALVWTANLAAVELHPTLGAAPDLERPRAVVFDLDPGAPADVVTAGEVALLIREVLERFGLTAWPKTSGSKGLQLYVPLNGPVGFHESRAFALAVARLLERSHPDLVVTTQERVARPGKVLIDWGQNAPSRTTVAAYSLRALQPPGVSTPVTWDEVAAAVAQQDAARLRFSPSDTLRRVERDGDLMAPVLTAVQELPALG